MPIPDFIAPGEFVEWTTTGTSCAVAQILSVTPTHIMYLSSDGVTASVFASQHFSLEEGINGWRRSDQSFPEPRYMLPLE